MNLHRRFIHSLVFSSLATLAISCGDNSSTSQLHDQFSGHEFFHYARDDRLRATTRMAETIALNYGPLVIKERRLGLDTARLFDAAIEAERAVVDAVDARTQAIQNLAYLDRMQALIASFQDTHFRLREVDARPLITNGLVLREVGGHVTVVGSKPGLLALAEARDVVLGDRVIAIDGEPVDAVVAQLALFEAASSAAYRRSAAIQALARRSYALPTSRNIVWTLESTQTGARYDVRLPYYYIERGSRKDARRYMQDVGIQSYADILPENRSGFRSIGYDEYEAPASLETSLTWFEDQDWTRPAIRTGYLRRKDRSYAVLQLFTYDVTAVASSEAAEPVDYFRPIIQFLRDVKLAKIPLIIDLRFNDGGNGLFPSTLLSHLARAGETYPNITASYRLTRRVRKIVEDLEDNSLGGIEAQDAAVVAVRRAVTERTAHTYAFTIGDDIVASEELQGFEQPVVALISPDCISACDRQALLFRASKRVVMLGTAANGTGAGFRTSLSDIDTTWRDDDQILSLSIPNNLWGFPGDVGKRILDEPDAFLTYNSENMPTEADVHYEPTTLDYLQRDAGWFDAAVKELEHQ